MELIDKGALVAEIERRKQDAINNCGGLKSMREHECDSCIVEQYEEMKNILDTKVFGIIFIVLYMFLIIKVILELFNKKDS